MDAAVQNYCVADDSVRGGVYGGDSLMPCAERGPPKCCVGW